MSPWLVSALIGINTLCALIVSWSSICALNHMRPKTNWGIRIAHIIMGLGAFSAMVAPQAFYRVPSYTEVLVLFGVALLVHSDRRRRNRPLCRGTV